MRKGGQTILDAVRTWDGRSPLPDEDWRGNEGGFSTDALDNVRMRHFGLDPDPKTAHLFRALEDGDRETLYRLMLQHNAVDHAEVLASRVESSPRDCESVAEGGRWILLEGTDRDPVKYALTLLGVCGSPRDAELVMTFARHDEFTMFAASRSSGSRTIPSRRKWRWRRMSMPGARSRSSSASRPREGIVRTCGTGSSAAGQRGPGADAARGMGR